MERIKINAKGSGEVTSADIETLAQSITEGLLTDDSDMEGNLTVNVAYEDSIEVIEGKFPKVHIENEEATIRFADPEVHRILVEHGVGTDGFITKDDCAKITSIGTWFAYSQIKLFNEFKYFTGIIAIVDGAFNKSTIEEIELPSSVITINGHGTGDYNAVFYGTHIKCLDLKNVKTLTYGQHFQSSTLKDLIIRTPLSVKGSYRDVFGSFRGTNIQRIFIKDLETYLNCSFERYETSAPSYSGNASLYLIGSEEPLTSLTIPLSITSIKSYALYNLQTITALSYDGTIEQWLAMPKGTNWHTNVPAAYIQCTDGKAGLDDTVETGNTYTD